MNLNLPDAQVVALIEAHEAEHGPGATVLEAGCGRMAHFAYPGTMRIVGLDISPLQLERNDYAHEMILGDVQTHRMDRTFDAVVSIYVLEHVEDPEAALANMLAWTKPGGLVVIAVPNALSIKGLVTKYTPFWFHHLAYKILYRKGYEIFPTTMKFGIAPRRLRKFFGEHRIELEVWGKEKLAQPFGAIYDTAMFLLRVLSLGQWRPERSNYMVVVRKAIQ